MSSLYELTAAARQLQELLESGDIDDQTFADTLECLDVETKVENICKMIRNMSAKAEAFKKEKDRLAARQKTAENAVERLKGSLVTYLSTVNEKSLQAGIFKVSMGTSEKLHITNEKLIPNEYLLPQPPKVDGARIKAQIKDGAVISGAEVQKSFYVTIR